MPVSRLLAVFALTMAVAFPVKAKAQDCGSSFYWTGHGSSVAVWPSEDLIRIELAPVADESDHGDARLIAQTSISDMSNGLLQASLSIAPPSGVVGPPDDVAVRLRFGRQKTGRNHVARREIFPRAGQPDRLQVWGDFTNDGSSGWAVSRQFRRSGFLTAVLVARSGRGRWREEAEARFAWSDLEELAARGQAYLSRCRGA